MFKELKLFSGALFGLFVAAALAAGVHTAFAQSVTETCVYDPPRYLGTCSSQGECDTNCKIVDGSDAQGRCVSGCCQCLF